MAWKCDSRLLKNPSLLLNNKFFENYHSYLHNRNANTEAADLQESTLDQVTAAPPPPGMELAPPTADALPLNLTNTLTSYHQNHDHANNNMEIVEMMSDDIEDEVETFEIDNHSGYEELESNLTSRPRRPKTARK